ncbi:hypothetical protein BKA66DRAFT_530897 [Pyrenochaeta sp. MPI-SDFR-AT-0127]|nr:hypothetical protein BKA66DRAFT_530897 [Pyrenochaeta sp. MPI-SDFR-AT-0127]
MAEVQSSPSQIPGARPETERAEKDKDALVAQLDQLLERYLHTLDEYEKVRQELSKQLSSGYMSLAQANFHNSSATIRYGQDCYDERMQVIRKIAVTEGKHRSDEARPYFSTFLANDDHEDVKSAERSVKKDQKAAGSQAEPCESGAESPENSESKQPPSADTAESTKKHAKPKDPLRWFGILVPPALRTAQSTFVAAVEGPIPQLATIARDLRAQEIEIGRVRKQVKKL